MANVDLIQCCADKAEQTYTGTQRVTLHTSACSRSNSDARHTNSAKLAYRDSLSEEKIVEEDDCRDREDLRELKETDGVVRQG